VGQLFFTIWFCSYNLESVSYMLLICSMLSGTELTVWEWITLWTWYGGKKTAGNICCHSVGVLIPLPGLFLFGIYDLPWLYQVCWLYLSSFTRYVGFTCLALPGMLALPV